MMEKGFLDRLNNRINLNPTTVPLDVSLLGHPLDEAVCIDIDRAVRSIATSESAGDSLSFSDLTPAHPPVHSDNLFVQFHTAGAHIRSEFPGWIGVHIVPFSVARHSHMFSLFGQIPERINRWQQAYAMIIYREWPMEISIGPAGMLLGLEKQGTIIDAAMFSINFQSQTDDNKTWDHVSRLTAWIVYLTFCCFTMVNQREAPLESRGPGLWQI